MIIGSDKLSMFSEYDLHRTLAEFLLCLGARGALVSSFLCWVGGEKLYVEDVRVQGTGLPMLEVTGSPYTRYVDKEYLSKLKINFFMSFFSLTFTIY
jgi:hypothetical protein